jgi:hypothetical protein
LSAEASTFGLVEQGDAPPDGSNDYFGANRRQRRRPKAGQIFVFKVFLRVRRASLKAAPTHSPLGLGALFEENSTDLSAILVQTSQVVANDFGRAWPQSGDVASLSAVVETASGLDKLGVDSNEQEFTNPLHSGVGS